MPPDPHMPQCEERLRKVLREWGVCKHMVTYKHANAEEGFVIMVGGCRLLALRPLTLHLCACVSSHGTPETVPCGTVFICHCRLAWRYTQHIHDHGKKIVRHVRHIIGSWLHE